jgi:hypothetical protein
MHHSNELEKVAGSLFDRLAELDLSFDGAFIFLFEKESRNIQLWIASKHISAPYEIELPHDKEIENNVIIQDLWHALENGERVLNRSYSGECKNEYFRYVWKYNEAKIPDPIRQIHIERDWTVCLVAEKNSIVGFDSWSGNVTSEEDFQILIRFARVFEQAYVRFLDLQKAEAQAREAQIEAALERVRSRTLAMQKSDELAETAAVVFKHLILLGIAPNRLYITIMKEDDGMAEFWTTDEDGSKVSFAYTANLKENSTFLKMYQGWKQQQKTLIIPLMYRSGAAIHKQEGYSILHISAKGL